MALSKLSRRMYLMESVAIKMDVPMILTRTWVHEFNQSRDTHGEFNRLYRDARKYNDKFFNYLRMTQETFDSLLGKLERHLYREETNFRRPISPEERLVITLRFVASDDSFASLSLRFRLGKSTVAAIVKDTCKKEWEVLHEEYIPEPTTQLWYDVAKQSSLKWNFPNCIGSIDGKLIEVKCPSKTGSLYYNYKQYFSIVLQAVADADCRLIAVDVGAAGRQSDGGTFRTSSLFQKLEAGILNVPDHTELPDTPYKVPLVLVGDEAYPLLPYLMRPFPRRNLNDEQLVFNYRLSRARKCIECAFGIMSAKWRILYKPIETNVDLAISIVNAICVLHNFVIAEEGIDPQFMSATVATAATVRNKESGSHFCFSNSAKQVREILMHYFSGPGKLTWQNNYAIPENIVERNAEVNREGLVIH